MGQRHIWEDIYALEIFPTTATLASLTAASAPTFDGVSTTGVRGITGVAGTSFTNVVYNLLPTDHQTLKASSNLLEKDVVTGKSIDNAVALTPVTKKPENVTIPLIWNNHNFGAMALLFFQNGCSFTNNAGTSVITAVPYTDSAPVRFGSLIRFMQDIGESDAVDQWMKAVIIKKLTIKGEEGGIFEGDAEFMPAAWVQGSFAGTAGQKLATCKPFDVNRALRFEDCTVQLGNIVAGTATGTYQTISVPKMDITFENNAFSHFYNASAAKVLALGKLEVTGTLTVPWNDSSSEGKNKQITDFIAGNTKQLKLTLVETGNFNVTIELSAKITDYTQNDIDGLPMLEIKFKMIEDNTSSYVGFPLTVTISADATKTLWR